MTSLHSTVCLHNMFETGWYDPEKNAREESLIGQMEESIDLQIKIQRNEQKINDMIWNIRDRSKRMVAKFC